MHSKQFYGFLKRDDKVFRVNVQMVMLIRLMKCLYLQRGYYEIYQQVFISLRIVTMISCKCLAMVMMMVSGVSGSIGAVGWISWVHWSIVDRGNRHDRRGWISCCYWWDIDVVVVVLKYKVQNIIKDVRDC